jgi:2-dehydropantoate 2-reductase
MRILVVGAGAIGGYFGGRLLEAGQDVTFLVRQGRAKTLARTGLVIHSSAGEANLPAPPTVLASELHTSFDLVLLSCKAYDLEQVIEDIAPAIGPDTAILPLLNGMRHLDLLDARFGARHVLGGQCVIAATLDADGAVRHLNESHSLTFGERDKPASDRVKAVMQAMSGAHFEPRSSEHILQDMWEKWVFLATLAGMTCLMRASVGDIVAAPGGNDAMLGLLGACQTVAEEAGHAPRTAVLERARSTLTAAGSPLTASMMRDLESGAAIEADHIVGDMIARAGTRHGDIGLLRVVYTHLKAYEAVRQRKAGTHAG